MLKVLCIFLFIYVGVLDDLEIVLSLFVVCVVC